MHNPRNPLPSRKRVMEVVAYNQETGIFTWLARGMPKFDNQYAGKEPGKIGKDGRRRIVIDGTLFSASRLAWLIVCHSDSDRIIDHIDCDPSNNAISNLREADTFQNASNAQMRKNNTSGAKGVCLIGTRYRARVWVRGKRITVGTFASMEAAAAKLSALRRIVHGAFSRDA